MPPSLSTLSEREQRMLRLLAEGHTVKSAIDLTGDSEYAANELLRSARRKLGVSSSREAARLWADGAAKPQETRDPKTVIAEHLPARSISQRLIFGGMAMGVVVFTAVAVFLVHSSGAHSVQTLPNAGAPSTEVPVVVSTTPADGSVIASGPFTLSVTYDQPMAPRSMSFATGPNPAFPDCDGQAQQSADGRTYAMECVAEPGRDYAVWFNHGRYRNFRSAATGQSAEPYGIAFTTRN